MTLSAAERRWRAVGVMALIAVLAAGVGWGAAQLVRSPAQVAADAAAPPASTITAPVENRVLQQTLVTRGSVAPARATTVQLRAPLSGEPIVTALRVAVGDAVEPGAVLVEIAGRPVFALRGSVPAYRSLVPGSEGEDVRQLQSALGELGFSVPADGRYGSGTAQAVAQWYVKAGFAPAPASEDDAGRREAALTAVVGAERAVEDLRDAGDTASPRQLERANDDLEAARTRLAGVEATTGASVPASEIVVLDSFPGLVREIGVHVGATVGEGTLVLSSGTLGVTGAVAPHMTGLVREGQVVELVSEALGQQASGVVAAVTTAAPATGDQLAATGGPTFAVTPTEPLPAEWNGQDVRVTVVAASTDAPVLVVPLAAVSSDAGQRTRVFVVAEDGSRRVTEVTTGVVGDGFVQVTPIGSELEAGERVLIGTSAASPSGVSP